MSTAPLPPFNTSTRELAHLSCSVLQYKITCYGWGGRDEALFECLFMGFTSVEFVDLRVVVADSRAGTHVDEGKRRAFLMRKEVTQ